MPPIVVITRHVPSATTIVSWKSLSVVPWQDTSRKRNNPMRTYEKPELTELGKVSVETLGGSGGRHGKGKGWEQLNG